MYFDEDWLTLLKKKLTNNGMLEYETFGVVKHHYIFQELPEHKRLGFIALQNWLKVNTRQTDYSLVNDDTYASSYMRVEFKDKKEEMMFKLVWL